MCLHQLIYVFSSLILILVGFAQTATVGDLFTLTAQLWWRTSRPNDWSVHAFVCVCIPVYKCMYHLWDMYLSTYPWLYVAVFTHLCTTSGIRICSCIRIRVYMHLYMYVPPVGYWSVHAFVCVCIPVYKCMYHLWDMYLSTYPWPYVDVFKHLCTTCGICTCSCIRIRVYIHLYMYVPPAGYIHLYILLFSLPFFLLCLRIPLRVFSKNMKSAAKGAKTMPRDTPNGTQGHPKSLQNLTREHSEGKGIPRRTQGYPTGRKKCPKGTPGH